MKIIGGQFRGRELSSPKGLSVRPTAARVREALFNIIGPDIESGRFLDLFAGAGAIGFEALSRGADRVVMVESEQIDLIAKNAARLKIETGDSFHVMRADYVDAIAALKQRGERFELIYADPPWSAQYEAEILRQAAQLLTPGGRLILEAFVKTSIPKENIPANLVAEQNRCYGDTVLHFFRAD